MMQPSEFPSVILEREQSSVVGLAPSFSGMFGCGEIERAMFFIVKFIAENENYWGQPFSFQKIRTHNNLTTHEWNWLAEHVHAGDPCKLEWLLEEQSNGKKHQWYRLTTETIKTLHRSPAPVVVNWLSFTERIRSRVYTRLYRYAPIKKSKVKVKNVTAGVREYEMAVNGDKYAVTEKELLDRMKSLRATHQENPEDDYELVVNTSGYPQKTFHISRRFLEEDIEDLDVEVAAEMLVALWRSRTSDGTNL